MFGQFVYTSISGIFNERVARQRLIDQFELQPRSGLALPRLEGEPTIECPIVHEPKRRRTSVIQRPDHFIDELIVSSFVRSEPFAVPME